MRVAICAVSAAVRQQACEHVQACGLDVAASRTAERSEVEGASALVFLNSARSGEDFTLQARCLAFGDRMPVIVVGVEPSSGVGVGCWLPSLPKGEALHSLVTALVTAGPPSGWPTQLAPAADEDGGPKSFRRKADMILGTSKPTRQLLRELDRLAPSAATVLVVGESGTGKELVARALHYTGPRAKAPFVALNCAAIPEGLVEAELFGYRRGAFTGAVTNRVGAFEAASEGTLFLDEIGEMPRAVQSKLLRVLETSEVTPLGGSELRRVSCRLVAATNRDLEIEVREGRFREDLFYRLNVYPIQTTPLRQRPEDIPSIVAHQLTIVAEREKRPTPRLTAPALEKLITYHWPGNVRELVHLLTRAVLLSSEGVIDADHIRLPTSSAEHRALRSYRTAKFDFERDYYSQLMQIAEGNVAQAARLADKTRKEVYEALRRLGIEVTEYRQSGADESSPT